MYCGMFVHSMKMYCCDLCKEQLKSPFLGRREEVELPGRGRKRGFNNKTQGKKGAEYTEEVISHVAKCRKKIVNL